MQIAAFPTVALVPSPPRTLWTIAVRRLRRNAPGLTALGFLLVVHLLAVLGPWLLPWDPFAADPITRLAGSSALHPLGTDEIGRDVLARLMLGARVSLSVGLVAMIISVSLGVAVGALAGYSGRGADAALLRFTDAMLAPPPLFVILAALAVFGGGPATSTIVIGLTIWMPVARIVRGISAVAR